MERKERDESSSKLEEALRELTGVEPTGETAENEVLLDRMLLGDLLKMLNGRQREIIVRHYFYDQTQTQIAAQLGISQVQVSRIERKILGQMRAKLEET